MFDNIFRAQNMISRSLSAENPTGGKGIGGSIPLEQGSAQNAARSLGTGWKVSPFRRIEPGETAEIANVDGEGMIQQIWMTPSTTWRFLILRFYWDGAEQPSVECPMGDFFCMGWGKYAQINSLAVCVNPGCAFNCYWPMPFKKNFRITVENMADQHCNLYYQINYCLTKLPEDASYFHAQFRRVNPLPYKDVYTIVDNIHGKGHYVGTYLAWGVNNSGWWGEGEIKFYMDGDREYPTICGTGTEDYFGGSYNFEDPINHNKYQSFSTPYTGLCQVLSPDALYQSQFRFGMYRWHLQDPICFEKDLKVTIQALGWRADGRYLPLQDDIASVAFWYQDKPAENFPPLPDRDYLEVI